MKNKKIFLLFILMLLALSFGAARADGLIAPVTDPDGKLDPGALKETRKRIWDEWKESMLSDVTVQNEMEKGSMTFGEAVMRFTTEVIGEMPENGYPLYIAMHGGGSGETPDLNDSQWVDMQSYYSFELDCGVYVAVRGVRDTWDTHFNPESYPLYDRLIEYMILSRNVDPNRVYLLGFSAGGDGVYAVGARMADRFAAANMSSGHPNGIALVNFYNLPLQLQAGEHDTDYDRNIVTAEYGLMLDQLQAAFPNGYEHRTLIHADRGHNYEDCSREPVPVYSDIEGYLSGEDRSMEDLDTFAPDWLETFVRDPLPEIIRWDLGTRAEMRETQAFYYLSADAEAKGIIQVRRDGNNIILEPEDFEGDFMIYFNEDMIDFSQPVRFEIADKGELDVMLTPEEYWLRRTTDDRGDPNYQFEAAVSYSWLLQNL